MVAASRIGDYFKAAAINAFAEMGADPGNDDAVYLLDRIRQLEVDEVSERDMYKAAKKFKKKADIMPAVDRLVDHGYLVPLPDAAPTGGRPASARYIVTKGPEGPKVSGRTSSGPLVPLVPS